MQLALATALVIIDAFCVYIRAVAIDDKISLNHIIFVYHRFYLRFGLYSGSINPLLWWYAVWYPTCVWVCHWCEAYFILIVHRKGSTSDADSCHARVVIVFSRMCSSVRNKSSTCLHGCVSTNKSGISSWFIIIVLLLPNRLRVTTIVACNQSFNSWW